MLRPHHYLNLYALLYGLLLISQHSLAVAETPEQHPIIPGLVTSQLDETLAGRVLVEELNCVACHPADTSLDTSSKMSPRLSSVGQRLNPYYLEQFIASPVTMKPGTTMPSALDNVPAEERTKVAKALSHFLLSQNKANTFTLSVVDTVAATHGQRLFHSVGCVACHSPRDEQGNQLLQNESTPLGELEKKYHTSGLTNFLTGPHKVRPSGRMPNMKLSRQDATRIANYLLQKTKVPGHLQYTLIKGRVWEGLEVNVERERSGQVQDFALDNIPQLQGNSALIYEGYLNVASQGEYSFYLEVNGGELWINDQQVMNLVPSSRRGVKKIEGKISLQPGWNAIKVVYIHAGKEPGLEFEMEGPNFLRQAIPSSMLSVSKEEIKPFRPYQLDPELITRGKAEFAKQGCVNCHDDIKVPKSPQKPWVELTSIKGCLSETKGAWPDFHLSNKQRNQIRKSLPGISTKPLTATEQLHKSLVTFNCLACHARTDLGEVSPERNQYFTGEHHELGNENRIPPPLTQVGAKLPTAWLKEVLIHGQQQRNYMHTTMPQFGETNVGHLINLFEEVDQLDPVEFAEIKDVARYKAAGHQLIGTTGFSCIACHDFNGQKAAGPGAMDIINSTSRLKKDWFYHFILKPSRFRANTVMPTAWPNGHVFKKEILDGDAKKQIESLWIYLEDGQRTKNPIGLSRKSPELRVTDHALIARGRGNAGYRGIAVGYPNRISLAFDSLEMNLRALWKGDYVTTNNNSFSARGTNRIDFSPGVPFHRLASLDDEWPYKRKSDYLFPQDHGYQFRGYYLDKLQRPTFMYRYGDIKVEEFYEDLLDEKGQPYFQRTFTFEAPEKQRLFYFRAASGKNVAKTSKNAFNFGPLKVTYSGDPAIFREGETQEALLPITLPAGKTKLTLEYRW
ncbi:MAG: c-type cytochrome [Pirellulales bacterium]